MNWSRMKAASRSFPGIPTMILSQYDLDAPIEDIEVEGIQGLIGHFYQDV